MRRHEGHEAIVRLLLEAGADRRRRIMPAGRRSTGHRRTRTRRSSRCSSLSLGHTPTAAAAKTPLIGSREVVRRLERQLPGPDRISGRTLCATARAQKSEHRSSTLFVDRPSRLRIRRRMKAAAANKLHDNPSARRLYTFIELGV